ncbi:Uncharacterised protein [uncultured archaeon]|nr:Uncharacterised protein [uncultured archaeon]
MRHSLPKPANPEHVRIVTEGGGQYIGVWEGTLEGQRIADDLILFNSQATGSTLAIKEKDLTPERVSRKIADSDRTFGK